MSNLAYETYKNKEEELLKKYPGQCIWIEGQEIKGISSNLAGLLIRAENEHSDPRNSIVRKIEKKHSLYFMD